MAVLTIAGAEGKAQWLLAGSWIVQFGLILFANAVNLGAVANVVACIVWAMAAIAATWILRSRIGLGLGLLVFSGFLFQRALLAGLFWMACLQGDCI